jgi:hypothetical protein
MCVGSVLSLVRPGGTGLPEADKFANTKQSTDKVGDPGNLKMNN